MFADLIQEAVFGQHGQGREAANHHGEDGKYQMPEVVTNLLPGTHLIEVVGGQATQWKPVEITAAGKYHDQQYGEQKARDGVAHNDQRAGPDIKGRAMPDGLADTQRNGNEVGDQRSP